MSNAKSDAFTVFSYTKSKQIFFLIILNAITINCFSQNQWTWTSGYLISDAIWVSPRPFPTPLSVRGTPWILGTTTKPSVREHSAGGIVNNNDIYVYGGASLEDGCASDFWVYDISQQKWAFISDLGWEYRRDVIGQESTTAHPGGRNRMASAVDKDGNIWYFGGLYTNKNLNQTVTTADFWKYNTKTKKWTYLGDYNNTEDKPLNRYRARAWFDENNNFWMYGGAIDPLSGDTFSYNDLWMFDTHINQWKFISGNKNDYFCKLCPNGVYPSATDTLGTVYFPRARSDYGYWKDNTGNIWIYGGYAESHGADEYGDLWKFNSTTKKWTLISGNDTLNPSKTATNPGSRNAPYCWVGNDNKLYMMGGLRRYWDFLRDVWRINPSNGTWEIVKVDNLTNEVPVSAGLRIENSTNTPGSAVNTLNHLTTGSHTYLFSGYGMGINERTGFTGAMWRYSLDGYNANFQPIANADTIVTTYKTKIYCNIKLNDLPKDSVISSTIDVDINTAGIQDSVVTTNGVFSVVASTGQILFKPIANFQGTATLSYTFQNNHKYVSNTAQLKLYVYKCPTTVLTLSSPTNNVDRGIYDYQSNEKIKLSNKIISGTNPLIVKVNSPKSIEFLPGSVIIPNNGSTFEAKISGCN